LDELIETTGAVVMGRRAYDMAEGDFTGYEYQVPVFVLTHDVPEMAARGLTFTFITDGIESAIEQAKAAAGEKNVTVIGGANTAQQCIRAGVLDEIQIRLMPVLFGEGLRLFEHLGTERIELEQTRVREFPTRTDIRFRVVR
jgi:dihydrofolate reductase